MPLQRLVLIFIQAFGVGDISGPRQAVEGCTTFKLKYDIRTALAVVVIPSQFPDGHDEHIAISTVVAGLWTGDHGKHPKC